VGGVKEKVLAARRAGIGTVIIPTLTKDQLAEVDEDLLAGTTIVHADRLDQVLKVALNGAGDEG
jgi:ATP-dependent Lon protease